MRAQLAGVISAGLARAGQQSTCLATRSRVRPLLPVPSLTDEEREFVAYWLGGVFWRMRGGGLLQLGSTRSDASDEQVTPGASRFAGCCR